MGVLPVFFSGVQQMAENHLASLAEVALMAEISNNTMRSG